MNNNEGKYVMRPASPDEAGLFFALPPEQDEVLGAIGHVRIDFRCLLVEIAGAEIGEIPSLHSLRIVLTQDHRHLSMYL